jgi:hypothetical protein
MSKAYSLMDVEGYVRIGYANNADILREGLERISVFRAGPPTRNKGME